MQDLDASESRLDTQWGAVLCRGIVESWDNIWTATPPLWSLRYAEANPGLFQAPGDTHSPLVLEVS